MLYQENRTEKPKEEFDLSKNLTGHEIDFENTRILAEVTSYWPRLIIQGLEIKKLQPTVRANMQAGYKIDPIWDIYLGSLQS